MVLGFFFFHINGKDGKEETWGTGEKNDKEMNVIMELGKEGFSYVLHLYLSVFFFFPASHKDNF